MGRTLKFLAFDLGAESGRGVVGFFDGEKLSLEDVHRFPNGPVRVLDSLHWDVLRLWSEVKEALRLTARTHGAELEAIGVDTWGVDFGLLSPWGKLLGSPYHYRDARTDGMMEEAFRRVPREEIFERTGIQFMKLNALYQLLAMRVGEFPLLGLADKLLMMPDLFNYFLTGEKVCEFSEATTSQFYDPRKGDWSTELLTKMDIPTHFLAPIVQPGTVLGGLLPSVAEDAGLGPVQVVAPACHDTGSAVAAVPATGTNHCYLSSGTWSLLGVEVTEPIITPRSLELNFTNEGGVCGTFRFLKNIMGLWLVQESRRQWEREGDELSYNELTQLAEAAPPFVSLVEPDDESFLAPGDMPGRIRAFCERTGQPAPQDKGAVVRCALESLALRYRSVIESLEEVTGRKIEVVHIVGGGSQNNLLNQLTADCTGRPVVAGPVEATAIGNVLFQAMGRGHLSSLDEAREVVRRSFEVTTLEPKEDERWEAAFAQYRKLPRG